MRIYAQAARIGSQKSNRALDVDDLIGPRILRGHAVVDRGNDRSPVHQLEGQPRGVVQPVPVLPGSPVDLEHNGWGVGGRCGRKETHLKWVATIGAVDRVPCARPGWIAVGGRRGHRAVLRSRSSAVGDRGNGRDKQRQYCNPKGSGHQNLS